MMKAIPLQNPSRPVSTTNLRLDRHSVEEDLVASSVSAVALNEGPPDRKHRKCSDKFDQALLVLNDSKAAPDEYTKDDLFSAAPSPSIYHVLSSSCFQIVDIHTSTASDAAHMWRRLPQQTFQKRCDPCSCVSPMSGD